VDLKVKPGCVVCGGSLEGKKRAKEDITPVWLQKLLGIARTPADPRIIGKRGAAYGTVQPDDEFVVKRHRKHNFSKSLAGEVCDTCNNGWMSELENAVKPILQKLIADPQARDFKVKQRDALARWLLKTGFMEEQGNRPAQAFVPAQHIRQVREGTLPEGVVLFVAKTDLPARAYQTFLTRDWIWHGPEQVARSEGLLLRTYKVALQINQLIAVLVYVPSEYRWTVSYWTRLHHVLLNNGVKVGKVPFAGGRPDDVFSIAMTLLLSLGRWPVEIAASDGRRPVLYKHEIDVHEWFKLAGAALDSTATVSGRRG
jgi:hypothetical protein